MDSRWCEWNCLKASTRCATAEKAECESTAPNDMMQEIWTCERQNPRWTYFCLAIWPRLHPTEESLIQYLDILGRPMNGLNACQRSADELKAHESTSGWVTGSHTPPTGWQLFQTMPVPPFPVALGMRQQLLRRRLRFSCHQCQPPRLVARCHGLSETMADWYKIATRWYKDIVTECRWDTEIHHFCDVFVKLTVTIDGHFTSIHLPSLRCTVPVAILTG